MLGTASRVVTPVPRDAWTRVWEASPEAAVFHAPDWFDACCRAHGFEDASRLYETVDGERIVIPLVRSRAARLAWRTTWSMPPGWGFGGVFGTRPVVAEDVTMVLQDVLRDSVRLVVNPGPVTGGAWAAAAAQARVRHDVHVVDLRQGFDTLWSSAFSSDTRNKVRKAEKRGVDMQSAPGIQLLRDYWDLYLRWTTQRAKDRGIPVPVAIAAAKHREPLDRLETIGRALGERFQIMVARVDGRPAAAVIALLDGVQAHYWRAVSDKTLVRRLYANHLLLARLLERASAHGCHLVHMGESGGVPSLIQFKEHFGAQPVSYDELRFEPTIVTSAIRAREHVLGAAGELALRGAARLAPR